MDLESLTQRHLEILINTMDVLTAMLNDNKLTVDEKLKTAKQIDSMSTTIIAANFADKHIDKNDKTQNRLIKQLENLKPKDEE